MRRGRTIKIEHIVRKNRTWGKKVQHFPGSKTIELKCFHISFISPHLYLYFYKTKQLLRQLITIFTNLRINPPERETYFIKIKSCHYVKCILQRKLLINFKIRELMYRFACKLLFSLISLIFCTLNYFAM